MENIPFFFHSYYTHTHILIIVLLFGAVLEKKSRSITINDPNIVM